MIQQDDNPQHLIICKRDDSPHHEVMNRHLQAIVDVEEDAEAAILGNHVQEFAVVEEALGCIAQGFSERSGRESESSYAVDRVRLFLVVRSFNSVCVAMQALKYGYYQQAWTLVRSVMEDQLIAQDAETNGETLDALLTGNGKLGKGNLTFSKMAERVSPQAKEVWDRTYGRLSEYGAHPRHKSMMGIYVHWTQPGEFAAARRPLR